MPLNMLQNMRLRSPARPLLPVLIHIGDGQVLPSMKGDTVIGINRIILITSSSQIENLVTDGRNYTGLGTLKTTTNVLMITEA